MQANPSFFSTMHTTPNDRPRKRVLLAMYWWEDRVLEGVSRVAAEQGWVLDCRMRWTHELSDLEHWRGDGIIANPGVSRPLRPLLQVLHKQEVPIVGLQPFRVYPCDARVVTDHVAIARLAAAHFKEREFRRVAFVAFADNAMENTRGAAFLQAAHDLEMMAERVNVDQFEAFLNRTTKPIGLWAANDLNAMDLTLRSIDAGYSIPEQIAIIGTDDTRLICDLAEVPLSSVNCNFEIQGELAAKTLAHLMNGGDGPAEPLVIQPAGVTPRRSTDTIAIPDAAAVKALRLLRDHYRTELRIPDIALKVGVSTRRLQQRFQQHVGHTMMHELSRLRVEHAKTLLLDEDLKLDFIAQECGFSDRFHFIRAFVRITGRRPAEFRNPKENDRATPVSKNNPQSSLDPHPSELD